jgi:hypothetical protein
MKYQISPLASDIIITIYVVITLFIRFKFEHNNYAVSPGLSLVFGLCCVVFLWALIKLKILNPNWFGLLNKSKQSLKK